MALHAQAGLRTQLGNEEAVAFIRPLLDHGSEEVRRGAVYNLKMALISARQFPACHTEVMTTTILSIAELSDAALVAHVTVLAQRERDSTANLIASLAGSTRGGSILAPGIRRCLPIAHRCCTCRNTRRMDGSRRRGPGGAFPSSSNASRTAP